jgi:hypothetical protein
VDQGVPGIDRDYMVKGRNSPEVTAYETFLRQLAVQVLGLTDNEALKADVAAAVQFEVDVANVSDFYFDLKKKRVFLFCLFLFFFYNNCTSYSYLFIMDTDGILLLLLSFISTFQPQLI